MRGVVADVAVGVGMGVAPLPGGLAEEGDVEQVGFAGVDRCRLRFGNGGRDERLLDGVGVDAVIDLRERALEVPPELEAVIFVVLEAAEFFDEIDFELGADPHAEFKGDVRVSIGAAVAPGGGLNADCVGLCDPLFDADLVAVQAGLTFNCGEFAIIKTRVEHRLPDAKKLNGVAVAKPVGDEKLAVLGLEHVGQGDVVAIGAGDNGDGCSLNREGEFRGLFHRVVVPVSSIHFSRKGRSSSTQPRF